MTNDRRFTSSGIEVPVFSRPQDVDDALEQRLGKPGEFPFTRGIHQQMYRSRPWTVRQLAGFGTAADTNQRYRMLLAEGATGVNGVFDYPSLRAFGSDDERAVPDVGRGGVAVDVASDFDDLFAEIPLEDISVSLVSSQPIGAVPHLAMFMAAAERRGLDPTTLRGTSQNDFLMETAVTIAPAALGPRASFRLESDLVEFACRALPGWNPVSFAGYNYREAGADAPLEMALALAHAQALADEMLRRGLSPGQFLPRFSFFLCAHADFFEEVAKFRALRRMWATVVRDHYGVDDPRCQKLRFHTQTSGVTNTAAHVHVNIARSALQALSAVLGGTQSMHINGYDEAISIPSQHSALTALRTQYVLMHEVGVTQTADPLAGSWLVESLTDLLESAALRLVTEIQGHGGLLAATENGWVHRELASRALEHQMSLEDGRRLVVGANLQNDGADEALEPFEIPPDAAARQQHRIAEARRGRDQSRARRALDDLARCCDDGTNTMPAAREAALAAVTLGEFGDLFRANLGTWDPPLW